MCPPVNAWTRAESGLLPSGPVVSMRRQTVVPISPRVWDGFRPGPRLTLAVITSHADTGATGTAIAVTPVPQRRAGPESLTPTRQGPSASRRVASDTNLGKRGQNMRDHRLRRAVGLILAVCVTVAGCSAAAAGPEGSRTYFESAARVGEGAMRTFDNKARVGMTWQARQRVLLTSPA